MRWRAFFFLKSGADEDGQGTGEDCELNSRKCPPQIEEMKAFEDDLAKLIENIKFRKVHGSFQNTLRKDVARIKHSKNLFVPADKTRNLYELEKERYEKLLRDNITKHYRAATGNSYGDINAEE